MSDLKEVSKLRRAMMPLFKMLPDALVEANEKRFKLFEKKIEALSIPQPRLIVKAPIINVPETKAPDVVVNVDTDTLVKAIIKSKTPDIPSAYEPHDQAKSQTFQYSGFVRSNGNWYIQRIAKGEQRYSKGHGGYTEAWEKRTKLKYGHIDQ